MAYKILIVDDECSVRESIIKKINWEALGFSVVGDAENGEDALEKVRFFEPDVVLTDIKMPYMDGLTLARHVKKEYSSIEIIIFSGFDDFEYAKEAIGLDVIEYILKPIHAQELTETLTKIKVKLDQKISEMRNIEQLKSSYLAMQPAMKAYFCNDLIQGKVEEEEIQDALEQLEFTIGNDHLVVAAKVYIDRQSQKAYNHWENNNNLIPISIRQLLKEQLEKTFNLEVFGSMWEINLICGFQEQKDLKFFLNQLHQVTMICKKQLGIHVVVGVGECYSGLIHVKKSYEEAENALGYRLTVGETAVIYNGDVENVERGSLKLDVKNESKLIHTLKFGTKEDVSEVMKALFAHIKEAKVHTNQYQLYMLSIMNALTQLAQHYEIPLVSIWGKEDYFKVIGRIASVEGMEAFLSHCGQIIFEQIRQIRSESTQKSIILAQQYIHQHYSDPDLSVERVCDYVHMSKAYFSTLFKQQTGQTYTSYVTDLRLEKAVALLNKTQDKTYHIAAQVGYVEPNYFSYVFKKKFGIAPSRYQRNAGDKK